ncbi:hypothetical protein CSR63_13705 [Salmonella enterica subsp. enterica serovar Weltevreden]|nr:hypothetical protein [Salmonella enterica subsp. enterica serovar Weltevreden]EDM5326373.1 hypothetical protein [Salmonella enterica subsp. enterica serovar Weltevreden]
MPSCRPLAVLLSWSTFTASVPSVPAATLATCRSAPLSPTDTVLSRSATEPEPNAAELLPVAFELLPTATALSPVALASSVPSARPFALT